MSTRTDGSSAADARAVVTIDLDSTRDRWRYLCPHGHTTWEPTNGGIWCSGCSQNHGIRDPQHDALVDAKADRTIPWSDVEIR